MASWCALAELGCSADLVAMTSAEPWDYAGFGDRFVADLCDGLIALVIALPIWFLVDRSLLGRQTGFLDDEGPLSAADATLWAWFLWNFTYLVGKTGQSWGRKLIGLKVVTSEGGPIGFWRALGRNLFAAVVSAPLLYLGFLWGHLGPTKAGMA
jgi:uncharacterized RDD family membrane protein YckC